MRKLRMKYKQLRIMNEEIANQLTFNGAFQLVIRNFKFQILKEV